MNKKISYLIKPLLLLSLMPATLMAGSIGDAAENLMAPTSIVMKLVEIGCYLIGLAFVLMSVAQYKIHRQSPKLVPLSTPITLLILGVIALFIPYTTKLAETGKSEVKQEEKSSSLPLPGQENKGAGLPYPPGHVEQSHEQALPLPGEEQPHAAPIEEPAATPESSGSGWDKYERK